MVKRNPQGEPIISGDSSSAASSASFSSSEESHRSVSASPPPPPPQRHKQPQLRDDKQHRHKKSRLPELSSSPPRPPRSSSFSESGGTSDSEESEILNHSNTTGMMARAQQLHTREKHLTSSPVTKPADAKKRKKEKKSQVKAERQHHPSPQLELVKPKISDDAGFSTKSLPSHKRPVDDETPRSSVGRLPLLAPSSAADMMLAASTSAATSSASCDLMAEVICRTADFTTELALLVASRTGYTWKPKLLQDLEKQRKPKKTKDPNEPRRPLSAYNLWCEHMRKKFKEDQPDKTLRLTDLAEMWKNLADKSPWEQAAKEKKDSYQQQLEAYRAGIAPSPRRDAPPVVINGTR